jgi:hypothetical protein
MKLSYIVFITCVHLYAHDPELVSLKTLYSRVYEVRKQILFSREIPLGIPDTIDNAYALLEYYLRGNTMQHVPVNKGSFDATLKKWARKQNHTYEGLIRAQLCAMLTEVRIKNNN